MSSKSKNSSFKRDNPKEVYISLIGAPGVGKSALMVKYITKRFIGEYDPNYEGIWHKNEIIDGREIVVQIYDTYDRDRKNLDKYIKWSDYLVLVYSLTNHDSFLEAQKYLDTIQDLSLRYSLDELHNGLPIKVLLLGTKLDLERYREVHKHDVESVIEKYSNKNNDTNIIIQSMETTSCEEYELVHNVFVRLVKEIKHDRENTLSNQQQQQQQFNYYNSNNDEINVNIVNSNKQNKSSLNYSKSRSKSPKPPANSHMNNNSSINNPNNSYSSINSNNFNNNNNNNNNNNSNIGSGYLNSNDMSNIIHSQSLSTQLYNNNSGVYNNSYNENNFKNNTNGNVDNNVNLTNQNSQSYQNIITHNPNASKKQSSKFPFFTKILNKS